MKTQVKSDRNNTCNPEEVVLEIKKKLVENGMSPKYNGFEYLAEAIFLFKPGIKLVNDIYVTIANKYGTTPSRVERCIRHIIEVTGDDAKNGDFISKRNFQWIVCREAL